MQAERISAAVTRLAASNGHEVVSLTPNRWGDLIAVLRVNGHLCRMHARRYVLQFRTTIIPPFGDSQ
jgi:hypothetical protein